jgi:PhzF family phenazine biosynthesis protein
MIRVSGVERRPVSVMHFRVFKRGDAGGNPCPVVTDAAQLTEDDMQQLAAHFGEESGFVCDDEEGGYRFRFFMPGCEVAMCVHATVAAVTALVHRGQVADRGELVVQTASGRCGVRWDDQSPPRVTVEQQPPSFGDPADVTTLAARALGVEPGSLDRHLPIRSVSVSTPKLIVPLRSADDVHRAEPDFDLLWKLCEDLGTTGAYVFAPRPEERALRFVARQFPVGGGVNEDAATGVAAGALAAYVADRTRTATPTWIAIEIDQGDAMGCPCTLHAAAYAATGRVLRTTVTGSATLDREEQLLRPQST